jgi:hypothetical protein
VTRDHFVKRRKFPKSLKRGTGGCNPCFKPSNEASKADLVEFHREDLKLRRSRQLSRVAQPRPYDMSRNADESYRKSIWPASKIERRA